MKEIKAYIRKDKLDLVITNLARIEGLSGVSVNTITGFGRSRGVLKLVDYQRLVKIETVCRDDLKDEVVATILENARTEQRGDGKVFVSDVTEAWRIETAAAINTTP